MISTEKYTTFSNIFLWNSWAAKCAECNWALIPLLLRFADIIASLCMSELSCTQNLWGAFFHLEKPSVINVDLVWSGKVIKPWYWALQQVEQRLFFFSRGRDSDPGINLVPICLNAPILWTEDIPMTSAGSVNLILLSNFWGESSVYKLPSSAELWCE